MMCCLEDAYASILGFFTVVVRIVFLPITLTLCMETFNLSIENFTFSDLSYIINLLTPSSQQFNGL